MYNKRYHRIGSQDGCGGKIRLSIGGYERNQIIGMGRRKLGIVFLIIAAMGFTGCGNSIPEMTEEQNSQIVEYAAGLLLKYDENYDSRLVDMQQNTEEAAEEEAQEPEKPATDHDGAAEQQPEESNTGLPASDGTSGRGADEGETTDGQNAAAEEEEVLVNQSIDEFYGIEGITIRYTGYELKDIYIESDAEQEPTNIALAITASRGCKLLILNFDVSNTGEEDRTIDMPAAGSKFKISINGEAPKYALTTMLANDLSSFVGTVSPGTAQKLVLVGEIPEEREDSIESISLVMKNVSEDATTFLE